jgi:hypothetical protein
MNTSADVSKFQISPCSILLKLVLGDIDGNLHFPVPYMYMLNLNEPATFSILSFWASLGIPFVSILSLSLIQSYTHDYNNVR